MNVKKQFEAIVELLKANENKKVSTVMPDILALVSKKSASGSNGSTVYKDEDGKVIAIFCYYHKKWELVDEVPFGSKANSTSGLNTMCKEGVSKWTKGQRDKKSAHTNLLTEVANGLLTAEDLSARLADLDNEQTNIIPREDGKGFDTVEELEAYLANR